MPLGWYRQDVARPWLPAAPIVLGRVEISPLFSWGGRRGPWLLSGCWHFSGDKKQQTVVLMGCSGGSFIVSVGLGGMESLEQTWAWNGQRGLAAPDLGLEQEGKKERRAPWGALTLKPTAHP